MTDPQLEQIAQERYGKSFEELDTREKQSVGGMKGGHAGEFVPILQVAAVACCLARFCHCSGPC